LSWDAAVKGGEIRKIKNMYTIEYSDGKTVLFLGFPPSARYTRFAKTLRSTPMRFGAHPPPLIRSIFEILDAVTGEVT